MYLDCSTLPPRVAIDRAVVDLPALSIVRGKRKERLTAAEAALLFILVSRANEIVQYEEIVAAFHATAGFAQGLARVKFTVGRLRKKLGRARRRIETVHGRGYLLRLRAEGTS